MSSRGIDSEISRLKCELLQESGFQLKSPREDVFIQMNISRFLVGSLVLCALPALAQPDIKPDGAPSFPKVSPEDAAKLGLTAQPIKLHLRDVTLRAALVELQKQSGIALDLSWGGGDALDKKLSLDIETRSFNAAFASILDEADVKARLQRWDGNATWNLQFGAQDESDAPQSGVLPFQLRATNLNSNFNRYVTPGKTKAASRGQSETLSVTFTLPSDPQLTLATTPRIRLSRAEDEAGHSLLLPPDPNRSNSDNGGGVSQQIDVSLSAPEKGSRTLAHLEGVATYVLADKREHWEIADLLKTPNATHTFESGGQTTTASLVGAEKKGASLQFEFQLRAPTGADMNGGKNPLFSFEQISASLHLRDAKGRTFPSGGYSGSGESNGYTLQLRYALPAPGQGGAEATTVAEPFALVFDAPTEFVQTEVPFSFSDLPLP